MIQLDSRKKIIIGSAIIILVIVLISVLLISKNNQKTKIINQTTNNQSITTKPQPRVMTQDEKTNIVGIDPTQQAEVLNDQDGIYAYRIKK